VPCVRTDLSSEKSRFVATLLWRVCPRTPPFEDDDDDALPVVIPSV